MRLVKESIERFFEHGLHVESRTIYLGDSDEDGIAPEIAAKFVSGIHVLQSVADTEIRVILNSMGGCWHNGMAIYDAIHDSRCHVTIEVLGSAMSMGAVILQAADDRVIHPNATVMLHDGSLSVNDTMKTAENWAQSAKKNRKRMYEIFADRSGKPVKYWERLCAADYILDAEAALAEKLVDRIVGQEATI